MFIPILLFTYKTNLVEVWYIIIVLLLYVVKPVSDITNMDSDI